MPPHSSDVLDNIVDYTAVAAKTLQDIVVVTQIPFLDGVCTLSLTIILIVQVWKSRSGSVSNYLSVLIWKADYQVSEGKMHPDPRGDSSGAMCTRRLVHPLGGHSIFEDA